jgi:hypothetical protein
MSFISDALEVLGEWILDGLCAIGNAIWSALTWLFQTVFVDPVVGLFNWIMNKIREKLKGIIFIVITIPSMIREIRSLMKSPSIKGVVKIIAKPFFGYVVSELAYAVISPFLFPTQITPPTIPSATPFPSAPAPPPSLTDYVRVNDYLTIELTDVTSLSDRISLEEVITLETYGTYSMSDSASVTDWLTLTLS